MRLGEISLQFRMILKTTICSLFHMVLLRTILGMVYSVVSWSVQMTAEMMITYEKYHYHTL